MFHLDLRTIEALIGLLSIVGIVAFNLEKFRKFYMLITVLIMLLRFYKHIAPMAKHYFDTHPMGKKLKPKTTIDNKITYLIKTHQLPYDNIKRHNELEKQGAQG